MASTFTPNIQIEEPARGDDVGVWDTPVNNNSTLLDLTIGAIATIALNNTNVVLSAAQFQSKQITFNSTLTGNVQITFPTSFTKSYEVQNLCTGAFTITMGTTSGGQKICPPPGETVDCFNDGSNIKFKNLGRIGSYMDYAGTALPGWITGCSVPPYLYCDGSAFSSGTYPVLAGIFGGTTLPDSRNRSRVPLAGGALRISAGVAGIDGNTLFAAGGDQNFQVHTHGNVVTDPGHAHGFNVLSNTGGAGNPQSGFGSQTGNGGTQAALTGISVSIANAGAGGSANVPPTYIGGITMIRAG